MKKSDQKKGLSDQQLIKKYETGKSIDFDKALKQMGKAPSPTTISKQKNKDKKG